MGYKWTTKDPFGNYLTFDSEDTPSVGSVLLGAMVFFPIMFAVIYVLGIVCDILNNLIFG